MMLTREKSEVWQKADAIYAEKIRPTLQPSDKGKYLHIHTGTGEWLMDADDLAAIRQVIDRWGYGQPVFGMRIGYRAVDSFRAGTNLELAEW